ncbi:MAG: hypothetical protein L0Y71_12385 [Gemmataceae bacterium]|nr:hypothetical protein [Gemmataceae bacterium]
MATGAQLDLVHFAIRAPTFGSIEWQPQAEERARKDPYLGDLTIAGIRALLRQFVLDGNSLEARIETRAEYREDHEYWYRARIPISGYRDPLFIEILLIDDDPHEPFVRIVNVHW